MKSLILMKNDVSKSIWEIALDCTGIAETEKGSVTLIVMHPKEMTCLNASGDWIRPEPDAVQRTISAREMGRSRSENKIMASRRNGKKGGRPKKQ